MVPIKEAAEKKTGGARLDKTKKSKAPLAVALLLAVLLAGGYAGLCAWATFSDTIWNDTYLLNQNVGGMGVEEAAQTLEAAFPNMEIGLYLHEEGQPVSDHSQGPDSTVAVTDLGAVLDAELLALRAYQITRAGNFWTSGWEYLDSLRYDGNYFYHHGSIQIEEAMATQAAAEHADALSQAVVHTSYALGEDTLSITKARDGLKVDAAALASSLSRVVWGGALAVDVPYAVDAAQTLTAQEIHGEIFGEVLNAAYDKDTDSIIPERVGADFDTDAAQNKLDAAEPGETVTVPARIQLPDVTAEELEALLFRDLLGECSTPVTGTAARRSNVALAAEAFDGYIMNPGDVFDYNAVVGQRTAERGFKPAPAYFRGETVDEIGGGICQTSSTLYLACLRANLEIVERYAHRYAPGYISLGMDATVSWGGPEFRFANNTDYPIKILTGYENGYVTVQLYGTNLEGTYAKVTYEYLGSTPWETVYQEDPTIPAGTQKVKTEPYTGHKVKTYHTIYDKDGNVLDSHYEATSDYKSRNKVILVAPGELPVEPEVPVAGTGGSLTPIETPDLPIAPETPAVTPDTPVLNPEAPIIVVPDLQVGDILAPLL